MVERDWNEYWRRLFKPITVKDISDYEKKYKGTGKRTVLSLKKACLTEAGYVDLEYNLCMLHRSFTNEDAEHVIIVQCQLTLTSWLKIFMSDDITLCNLAYA